jgi:hypothetical protein
MSRRGHFTCCDSNAIESKQFVQMNEAIFIDLLSLFIHVHGVQNESAWWFIPDMIVPWWRPFGALPYR